MEDKHKSYYDTVHVPEMQRKAHEGAPIMSHDDAIAEFRRNEAAGLHIVGGKPVPAMPAGFVPPEAGAAALEDAKNTPKTSLPGEFDKDGTLL